MAARQEKSHPCARLKNFRNRNRANLTSPNPDGSFLPIRQFNRQIRRDSSTAHTIFRRVTDIQHVETALFLSRQPASDMQGSSSPFFPLTQMSIANTPELPQRNGFQFLVRPSGTGNRSMPHEPAEAFLDSFVARIHSHNHAHAGIVIVKSGMHGLTSQPAVIFKCHFLMRSHQGFSSFTSISCSSWRTPQFPQTT